MSAGKMRVVSVHVEYLDHDHGHWCNTCQLGTGLRVWVAMRHRDRMHLQERMYCYECDGRNVTPASPDDVRHC